MRSDLTRPAINHYFANKRVLYTEVVQQTNAQVVSAGIERARTATTLVDRLEAFIAAAVAADSANGSSAAFLVTSIMEAQRHPELSDSGNDSLEESRQFVTWAVNEAVGSGELATGTDVEALVEMLLAVVWGMGFYAGFVGGHDGLERITAQLKLLLANRLWARPGGPAAEAM